MDRLILYNVSDDYVNYLRKFDRYVFSNKEGQRSHERKYLGIVLKVNEIDYFVPFSSPKETDYTFISGKKEIRKSIIPIIRMVVNNELKGTLKFSNMIPVPKSEITKYDLYNESDTNYKDLIVKQISFVKDNKEKIFKHASVIYNQKTKNLDIGYIKRTVNFKILEQKCKDYKTSK